MFEKIKTNLKIIKEDNRQKRINAIERKLFDVYYDIYTFQRYTLFDSYGIQHLDDSQKEALNEKVKEFYRKKIAEKIPEVADNESFIAVTKTCLKFGILGLVAAGLLGIADILNAPEEISVPLAIGACAFGMFFASSELFKPKTPEEIEANEVFRYLKSYYSNTEAFSKLADKRYEKERALKEELKDKEEDGLEL